MNLRRLALHALVFMMLLAPAASLVAPYVHAQTAANNPTGAATAANNADTGNCDTSGGGLVNPLNHICNLSDLLAAILDGVVQIGTVFLIFMLVYVGFLFVAARGKEESIRSAREALVWTVIGGLILLGAKAISLVIQNTVSTL